MTRGILGVHPRSQKVGGWRLGAAVLALAVLPVMSACGSLAVIPPHPASAEAGGGGAFLASSKVAWLASGSGILRSVDGGSSWHPSLSQAGYIEQSFFLGTEDAWAVAAGRGGSAATTLWRTTDGGGSWRSTAISTANRGALGIYFVSQSSGWLLLSSSGRLQLLSTSDGGAHWRAEPGRGLPAGSRSCTAGGISPQMSFRDRANGFIANQCLDGRPFLLATHDGGSSWSRLSLPNIESGHPGDAGLSAPVFLSPGSGAMMVTLAPGRFRFAITEDGGTDWWLSGRAVSTGASTLSAPFGILAPGRWIVGGVDRLFKTTNDGSSWKTVSNGSDLASLSYLNLLPSGQALAAAGGSKPAALRSTDGGKSWTLVSL